MVSIQPGFCKHKTDHVSIGQVKFKIFFQPRPGLSDRTNSLHAAHCSSEASAVESN